MAKPPETLKKRAEFLRLRGGDRWAGPAFVMESKPRDASVTATTGARFGFTVTKAMGNAVARNLIRRRLKAAVGEIAPSAAEPGRDYVLIARTAASKRPFEELKKDLEQAFQRVHHPAAKTRRAKR